MEIVDGNEFLEEVKKLIREYTERLNRDLSFQNLDKELHDLESKYSYPNGKVLVAVEDEKVYGLVAYCKHNDYRCEMKRLYVTPEARGKHLGEILIKRIQEDAKNEGYQEMVLDTITPLKTAIHLYEKQGFEECEAYYNNPMSDVIYMKKKLR
jgi:ribosomal protein S18 acetylase RimI-like enzyme